MGPPSVVVPGILGQDRPQVSFAEDQHPAGHLRPGGAHAPFRLSVRARASRRDLHRLDAGAGQDRVERCGALPGLVADQEPEARGPRTEGPSGGCGSASTGSVFVGRLDWGRWRAVHDRRGEVARPRCSAYAATPASSVYGPRIRCNRGGISE
jgi:hypothetical protein